MMLSSTASSARGERRRALRSQNSASRGCCGRRHRMKLTAMLRSTVIVSKATTIALMPCPDFSERRSEPDPVGRHSRALAQWIDLSPVGRLLPAIDQNFGGDAFDRNVAEPLEVGAVRGSEGHPDSAIARYKSAASPATCHALGVHFDRGPLPELLNELAETPGGRHARPVRRAERATPEVHLRNVTPIAAEQQEIGLP